MILYSSKHNYHMCGNEIVFNLELFIYLRIPSAVVAILRTLAGKTKMIKIEIGTFIIVSKFILIQERKRSRQSLMVRHSSNSVCYLCVLQNCYNKFFMRLLYE